MASATRIESPHATNPESQITSMCYSLEALPSGPCRKTLSGPKTELMQIRLAVRLYAYIAAALISVVAAAPANAQFKPWSTTGPTTGEDYHIEGSVGLWWPSADITVASSGFNIVGSTVDLRNDLGLTDQRFPELSFVLRPAKSHKFLSQYIPITYTQSGTLSRRIIFNGQNFDINLPVNSSLDWKAYRFGYEYDF